MKTEDLHLSRLHGTLLGPIAEVRTDIVSSEETYVHPISINSPEQLRNKSRVYQSSWKTESVRIGYWLPKSDAWSFE